MYGIKGQLLKAFLVVIAVLWLSTTLVLFINFQITQQYKVASDVMVSKYLLLESGADLNEAFNTIMLSADTDVYEADQRLLDAKNDIAVQKLFLEKNLSDIQSKAYYLGFAASLDEFTDLVDDGVSRFRGGNIDSYYEDFNAATRQFQFVQDNGITLLLGELEYFSTIRDDLSNSYRNSLINGVIFIVLLIVGCILYVFNFSKKFVLPLHNLTTATKKLAAGEIDVRIQQELLNLPNETGILATSFDQMAISLQDKVTRLNKSNKEIAQSAKELESKNAELHKLNQFMVDREVKMIELKDEIKALKEKQITILE
jgi:methyl-accepting chemotaxis protein